MRIEIVSKKKTRENGFFKVSPVDSWDKPENADSDNWVICCNVDTSSLNRTDKQNFLDALRQITFYQFRNDTVSIMDYVTAQQHDAFYEILEHFGLKTSDR